MTKVKKAVIPAAGFGTRVLPASKAVPKEMLPIVDKPAIQYIVEEAVASGIEDILIITDRGKEAMENHFDRAPELEEKLLKSGKRELYDEVVRIADLANITFIRQKEIKGLGHAIFRARFLCRKRTVRRAVRGRCHHGRRPGMRPADSRLRAGGPQRAGY